MILGLQMTLSVLDRLLSRTSPLHSILDRLLHAFKTERNAPACRYRSKLAVPRHGIGIPNSKSSILVPIPARLIRIS